MSAKPQDGGLAIRIASSIGAFTRAEWEALSATSRCEAGYNPFVSYDFLTILEESGCAVRARVATHRSSSSSYSRT